MKDIANERTEAAIANLELELKEHYMRASDDMHAKGQAYFEKFKERDREMRDNLKKGKITEDQYKSWRLTQIARGKRFDALADKLAEDAAKADLEAMAMVKGELPDIFALNYNYTAYTIEQTGADVDFSLYDRGTVETLVMNNPDILPDPSPKLTRDMLWNRKHIAAEITTAILQGEDIGKIADRLRNVTDMDERAAIRNARTAMTSAQNSGRQHNYEKAAELGIKVRKKWIATLDGRTRHEHGAMDGQIVDYDKPFHYGPVTMMFPGDMKAPPWMVYNCRCRTVTVEKDGIVAEPVQRRMRNPVTGRNELVSDMTYDEWVAAKNDLYHTEKDDIIISDDKFTKYLMLPEKSKGKAAAFKSALGYDLNNYEKLMKNIREHFDADHVKKKKYNDQGVLFEQVMRLEGENGKKANVLAAWIYENETRRFRLTTAYVTKKKVTPKKVIK